MAINSKTDRAPATGAPWELTASDWNTLWEQIQMARGANYGPVSDNATVLATGTTTARTLAERAGSEFWIEDFGGVGDGSTDDTAALVAAIAHLQAGRGGTLRFGAKTYRFDGQIALPNDGASPPKQKPMRFIGSGGHMSGQAGSPPGVTANGGTVFDMRYSGTYGKLQTVGAGFLELQGICFVDGAGTTTPWIYTTGTTLHIHACSFIGSKLRTACDQDCIVLGGTNETFGDADPTGGFQGYGTVIERNYFDRIRRAVWLRTFANACVVRDNTVWADSGSNLANGAAFDIQGSGPGGTAGGNWLTANTVEMMGYPYAFSITYGVRNSLYGNGAYDESTPTLGVVYIGAGAADNFMASNLHTPSVPLTNLTGSFSYNSALFDDEPLKLGFQIRGASGPPPLALYAGSENDCVYLPFYPRTASPTTRGGYIGFVAAADTRLVLKSEIGDLVLEAKDGAKVQAMNPVAMRAAAVSPAPGAFTISANAGNVVYIVLASAGGSYTVTTSDSGFEAQQLTVIVKNTSGGAVTLNWGGAFRLAGAWANPDNGCNRSVTFVRDYQTLNFHEVSRSAADVLNS